MQFLKNSLAILWHGLSVLLGLEWRGFKVWFLVLVGVALGSFIYERLEHFGNLILNLVLPERFAHPGFGIALVLVIFLLTALLPFANIFSRIPVVGRLFDRFFEIPVLRMLFGKRDGTFSRLRRRTPCLFRKTATACALGWIMEEGEVGIDDEETGSSFVNVFRTSTPGLLTGTTEIMPRSWVVRLRNPSRQIIDAVLYGTGGRIRLRCLPWEDETIEQLRDRLNHFGFKNV